MHFWVESIVERHIVEFVAEMYQSFSKTEVEFKKTLMGRLVHEIPL